MTMEVLSPPTQLGTPLSSSLFNERIKPGLFEAPSLNPAPLSSIPAASSDNSDTSIRLTGDIPPKKLVIGDFFPTIMASPICATTSTFPPSDQSSQPPFIVGDVLVEDGSLTTHKNIQNTSSASSSHSRSSLPLLFASPPTWISTPPTPPQRQMRRAIACDLRRPSSPVSPSASFPASTSPHVVIRSRKIKLQRCVSYPIMSSRSRAISEPAPAFKQPTFSHSSFENVECSLPKRLKRPIFQLVDECDDPPSSDDGNPNGGLDNRCSVVSPSAHGNKDAIRIYHALRELLTTEMDYVRDLRILHHAYIQRLSSFEVRTSAFARASASFTAGPWINSYVAIQAAQTLDGMASSSSSPSNFMKPVFSDNDIGLLARNLEVILHTHEAFLSGLQDIMSPLHFSDTTVHNSPLRHDSEFCLSLLSVLKAVSERFATKTSDFEVYQIFCAGHPEAVNLIRRVIAQYPSDWESFEQRCLGAISKIGQSEDVDLTPVLGEIQSKLLGNPTERIAEQRKRPMSPASLGAGSSSRLIKDVDRTRDPKQLKLTFTDYLIKPVQRICKYPLLLEQLKPRGSLGNSDEVGVAVQDAIQAIRNVVASVDEARREKEAAVKSSLIISRLVLPSVSPLLNPSSPLTSLPTVYTLTSSFLSSLGPCLLSGSLDVMYFNPQQTLGGLSIKAKYLGAFLYTGGYLILAKINKGKKYEPRHWFSVSDFDISSAEADEAMLPYSFRLCSKDIHFELAAACQAEKDVWLQHIRDSTLQTPTWTNEPLASYNICGRRGRSDDCSTDGSRSENLAHMPPGASDTEQDAPLRMDSLRRKITLKNEVPIQDQSLSSSRRSSSASVKTIFSPMGYDPNSILIHRSSTGARLQVDQDLQDVASQACISARLYASLHEELFQLPKRYRERSAFSRSNSAISVAGMARSRLSKQESLQVPRRKTRCDSMIPFKSRPEPLNLTLSVRKNGKRLSVQSLPSCPPDATVLEPSHPSTASSASTTPLVHSPMCGSPLSRPVSPSSSEPRSSRAILVRNVKDFFHIGSSQSVSRPPQHDDINPELYQSSPLLRRWKKSSLRRRSRSADEDSRISE